MGDEIPEVPFDVEDETGIADDVSMPGECLHLLFNLNLSAAVEAQVKKFRLRREKRQMSKN